MMTSLFLLALGYFALHPTPQKYNEMRTQESWSMNDTIRVTFNSLCLENHSESLNRHNKLSFLEKEKTI